MELHRKNVLFILLLIVLAGSALRIYNLDAASIRADEGGTIYLSERPALDILTQPQDVQPPLFYFLLHFWMELFGKSEFALRLLPALLSILAIPLVYLLGKELFNDSIGLFAAFVFAISQANIRFAQNLRMYSLLLIFALLSVYFLHRYLEDHSLKNTLLFSIATALAVYTHYFAGFLLIAEFAYAMLFYKKHNANFVRIFGMFALAGILIIPLIPMFLWQMPIKTGFEQSLGANDPLLQVTFAQLGQNSIFARAALIFYHFSVGFLLVNLKSKVFLAIAGLASLLFSAALLSGIRELYSENKTKLFFILMLLIMPVAVLAAIWAFKIIPPQTYTRYLLYLSPLYYILVGYGLFEGLPAFFKIRKFQKPILFIGVVLIVLFNAVSLNYYYRLDPQVENWKNVTAGLNNEYKSGDLAVLYLASYYYDLSYYFKNNASVYSLPNNIRINNADFADVYNSLSIINQSNACEVQKLIRDDIKTIWLVRATLNNYDYAQILLNKCITNKGYSLAQTFENKYTTQKGEEITDIIVYRFER